MCRCGTLGLHAWSQVAWSAVWYARFFRVLSQHPYCDTSTTLCSNTYILNVHYTRKSLSFSWLCGFAWGTKVYPPSLLTSPNPFALLILENDIDAVCVDRTGFDRFMWAKVKWMNRHLTMAQNVAVPNANEMMLFPSHMIVCSQNAVPDNVVCCSASLLRPESFEKNIKI